MKRSIVGGMVLSVGLAVLAQAQQDTSNVIDHIVAIVGTKAVVASQLQERAFQELGRELPQDGKERDAVLKGILSSLIDEELVVQEALRDTAIKVTDDEVTKSVDELFRNARSRYASEDQFRRGLDSAGFQTLEEWRSYVSDQQRRRFLADRFWDRLGGKQLLKSIAPTDKEVRECFDANCMRIPPRGEGVSFQQIIIAPKPSDAAKERARALADSILIGLRAGGDFEAAAKRFSQDPGSKEQGGSLNWIRRGQGLDPRFEEVAFLLKVGQISDPVETAFGWHLIQVQRAQPAELQVRHILIMPEVDSTNAADARKTAEAAYVAIKQGASFDSVQRILHDKSDEKDATLFPVASLPPAYTGTIKDTKEGELAPLFELEQGEPHRNRYVVLRVTARSPAGPPRFEDVRDLIRNRLGSLLARRKYLDKMRGANHVEVRAL